jgi:glutathione S-transferase
MKVFGHPLSSCTRKVLITLMEKRQAHTFVPVDLFAGEQKGNAHVSRHPFGVVPVLEDADFVLYESRAIIRYLDGALPGPRLTPKDPKEAARMEQWLSVDQSYIAPHTRALATERLVKKHQGKKPDPEVEHAAEEALARAFAVHDRALATSQWLAGDSFSLADASLAPYVASLPMIGAPHVMSGLDHLAAWWKRALGRASVASILAPG